MARTRIGDKPALKTWDEVDAALREIAEEKIALSEIEAEMNRQKLGITKIAKESGKPHEDRIAKLERDIKIYVDDHRSELGKSKTRCLNFGEVGYRISTKISVPKGEKLADVLRRLKARKMTDCITVKEDVDKVALKKYGEDTVIAVGATWKQTDSFGYDVYLDKLKLADGG